MTFQSLSELGLKLNTARDISDLIGAAYDLDGVLIEEADLSAGFFDLKTGLLGELFQKFTNYRKRVAFVVPDPAAHGERFAELAFEHRTHPHLRFVSSVEEGQAWLGGK